MGRRKHYVHQKRTRTGRFTRGHDIGHGHYDRRRKRRKPKRGFLGLW